MKGTIYGNRLPRDTQVKKGWETTDLDGCQEREREREWECVLEGGGEIASGVTWPGCCPIHSFLCLPRMFAVLIRLEICSITVLRGMWHSFAQRSVQ